MNLPLEYSELAEFFDALSGGDEAARNSVVEKLLEKYDARRVLDLTCGTGSQALWLAQRGYDVVGCDISPRLLDIARKKAGEAGLPVQFLEADMRSAIIGSFDAVITIFNAVGHLTKDDFAQAMRTIHSNLKTGGIYIFDIFNLDSMSREMIEDLKMDMTRTIGDVTIHHIQHSTLNHESGLLTSHDYFSLQKDGAPPRELRNSFSLQIYRAEELREMLELVGFEVLEQLAMDGSPFDKDRSQQILTVARKKR